MDGLAAATGPWLAGQVVDLHHALSERDRDAERQRMAPASADGAGELADRGGLARWGALAALACARAEARAQMMRRSTAINRIAQNGEYGSQVKLITSRNRGDHDSGDQRPSLTEQQADTDRHQGQTDQQVNPTPGRQIKGVDVPRRRHQILDRGRWPKSASRVLEYAGKDQQQAGEEAVCREVDDAATSGDPWLPWAPAFHNAASVICYR